MSDTLLINKTVSGRKSYSLPKWDKKPQANIPTNLLRKTKAELPELPEIEIVRHYTKLSNKNFSVDTHFYPLGSCTMKYNPKFNERIVDMSGFAKIHPLQPESSLQGSLELIYLMEQSLCEICGMDAFTLQPLAGAHGELTGMMLINAYHKSRGDDGIRTEVIVPDSSHGTNPSSAHLAGYTVTTIRSDKSGMVDISELKKHLSDKTAAFMLTNPNTLGVFEKNILEISKMVHDAGALLYYDGANLNPLMGICRPGDMGFDVIHLNIHKTFSAPHGGGGPGSGPVGVKKSLVKFLPNPRVKLKDKKYSFYKNPDTIGKVSSFYGNFGVILKGYVYILVNGLEGLRKVSESSIINANYILNKLKDVYDIPYADSIMHEFVISMKQEASTNNVHAIDVAKYLIENDIHPPTIYFPLIVDEALMIEPTETETKETLDNFVNLMIEIKKQIKSNPDSFHNLPQKTGIRRPNEVTAARTPILSWKDI